MHLTAIQLFQSCANNNKDNMMQAKCEIVVMRK
uniref:Uncharacterized protein n=1 Tax=viral metagenome TaxID=1070528 RepID=A0A6C0DTV6_9ZZZZ